MDFKSFIDYRFLWNGYGFRILKNMDYGMDMDLFQIHTHQLGYECRF